MYTFILLCNCEFRIFIPSLNVHLSIFICNFVLKTNNQILLQRVYALIILSRPISDNVIIWWRYNISYCLGAIEQTKITIEDNMENTTVIVILWYKTSLKFVRKSYWVFECRIVTCYRHCVGIFVNRRFHKTDGEHAITR